MEVVCVLKGCVWWRGGVFSAFVALKVVGCFEGKGVWWCDGVFSAFVALKVVGCF